MSSLNPNKIFVFGLDNAGKTTLTHFIRTGAKLDEPLPTKAFDITDFIIKDLDFRLWDAPGQLTYRKTWGKGLDSANFMLFILDTGDRSRWHEAKKELDKVLNDLETKQVPLIFCFHKMDIQASIDNYELAVDFFKIHLISERNVYSYFTSYDDLSTLEKLKGRLVELVEKGRW